MHFFYFGIILMILPFIVIGSTQESKRESEFSSMSPRLQQVSNPFVYGQGPYWDQRTQLLYFVDIIQGLVASYDPVTSDINFVHLDGDVSIVVPTETPNKFAVGINNSQVTFYWNGKNNSEIKDYKKLLTVVSDTDGNRFNAGKADRNGRLWWGTMGFENSTEFSQNQGSLYIITEQNYMNPVVEISGVNISGGLTWSKDNTKFYFSDATTREIICYDFNLQKGEISNKRVIFKLNDYSLGGMPLGMTTDEDDNLFIVLFIGGEVIKVNPTTGKLLQRIAIPANRVTNCAFGGTNLDILYVTTAKYGLSELELTEEPEAGAIFAITGLGTRGLNMHFTKI